MNVNVKCKSVKHYLNRFVNRIHNCEQNLTALGSGVNHNTDMNADGYDPVIDILQMDRPSPSPRVFKKKIFDNDCQQRYRLQENTVDFILERIKQHLELHERQGYFTPRVFHF